MQYLNPTIPHLFCQWFFNKIFIRIPIALRFREGATPDLSRLPYTPLPPLIIIDYGNRATVARCATNSQTATATIHYNYNIHIIDIIIIVLYNSYRK